MSWILLNAIRGYAEADLGPVDTRGCLSTKQADMIREYCNANLGEMVRLEHLADLVSLSRYHFLRKFKNTFEQSPHAFLTGLRMAGTRPAETYRPEDHEHRTRVWLCAAQPVLDRIQATLRLFSRRGARKVISLKSGTVLRVADQAGKVG